MRCWKSRKRKPAPGAHARPQVESRPSQPGNGSTGQGPPSGRLVSLRAGVAAGPRVSLRYRDGYRTGPDDGAHVQPSGAPWRLIPASVARTRRKLGEEVVGSRSRHPAPSAAGALAQRKLPARADGGLRAHPQRPVRAPRAQRTLSLSSSPRRGPLSANQPVCSWGRFSPHKARPIGGWGRPPCFHLCLQGPVPLRLAPRFLG